MTYEVEQKYRLSDAEAFSGRLQQLGASFQPAQRQVDIYYQHPARDFAATDEALRIRRVGDENCLTYKGRKVDGTTKTRREIELEIASGDAGAAATGALLEALGFRVVAQVCKHRRCSRVGGEVDVAIDVVDGVGTFAELEILAVAEELDSARTKIMALAAKLGLTDVERRSYLELLLAQPREVAEQP